MALPTSDRLFEMVSTTLAAYGAQLAEIKQNQAELKTELMGLRVDVVRLQERSYERQIADLQRDLKETKVEVATLKQLADRAEGMTIGARFFWGGVVSTPGVAALIYQLVSATS